jgi:uncharacterized protein (DUF488 family)
MEIRVASGSGYARRLPILRGRPRSVAELAGLVRQAGANLVVDVRTIPRSRTNPQFNADALPATLAAY